MVDLSRILTQHIAGQSSVPITAVTNYHIGGSKGKVFLSPFQLLKDLAVALLLHLQSQQCQTTSSVPSLQQYPSHLSSIFKVIVWAPIT